MKNNTQTAVVFRTYKGVGKETIALFPYEIESIGKFGTALCACFAHIDQHGQADYEGIIRQTRPATADEIIELTRELTNAPYAYNLRPILRRHASTYTSAYRAARNRF